MHTFFLKTTRLVFSHWQKEDLPLALRLWGDPDVSRFIHREGVFSQAEVAARLQAEMDNQDAYGIQYWPLFLLKGGDFVGCCGFRPFDAEPDGIEMGIHLLPAFWGQGLAKEAALGALAYAKNTLGEKNIYAGHHPHNEASRKLLPKLGFVYLFDSLYPPTGLMHPAYRWEG